MAEKIIRLTDIQNQKDILKLMNDRGGPKGTRIIIRDADTGELLQDRENKVLITGSIEAAKKMFGIESPIYPPTYNMELGLENTVPSDTVPANNKIVCLFCVDDSGCGVEEKDIYTVNYIDRIDPATIFPFRYVDEDRDLNSDLRKYYFGRKPLPHEGKIAYYFKAFEAQPEMHVIYKDGTQITEDSIYNVASDQIAEVYIESKLKVTRLDFRDYFEQVLGWSKARISSLSLCFAWYDDTITEEGYKWYQEITPYTKLNFSFEKLVSLDRAIMFYYQIFY